MTQKCIYAFKEFLLDYGLIQFFQSTFERHRLVKEEYEDYLKWVHPLFVIRFAFQWDADTSKKPSYWSQKDNSWIAYLCNRKLSDDINEYSVSTVQRAISKHFGNNKQFGTFKTSDPHEVAQIIIDECDTIENKTEHKESKCDVDFEATRIESISAMSEEDEEEEEVILISRGSKMTISDKSARVTNTSHTQKISFNSGFSNKLKRGKFFYYSITKTKSNCLYVYFRKDGVFKIANNEKDSGNYCINNKSLVEYIADYFSESGMTSGVMNFSDNLSMNTDEYKIQLLSFKREK